MAPRTYLYDPIATTIPAVMAVFPWESHETPTTYTAERVHVEILFIAGHNM